MLDELKKNAQIIARTAGPRPFKLSSQFVGLQPGIECVFREQF
jgi:hypothetical protein